MEGWEKRAHFLNPDSRVYRGEWEKDASAGTKKSVPEACWAWREGWAPGAPWEDVTGLGEGGHRRWRRAQDGVAGPAPAQSDGCSFCTGRLNGDYSAWGARVKVFCFCGSDNALSGLLQQPPCPVAGGGPAPPPPAFCRPPASVPFPVLSSHPVLPEMQLKQNKTQPNILLTHPHGS